MVAVTLGKVMDPCHCPREIAREASEQSRHRPVAAPRKKGSGASARKRGLRFAPRLLLCHCHRRSVCRQRGNDGHGGRLDGGAIIFFHPLRNMRAARAARRAPVRPVQDGGAASAPRAEPPGGVAAAGRRGRRCRRTARRPRSAGRTGPARDALPIARSFHGLGHLRDARRIRRGRIRHRVSRDRPAGRGVGPRARFAVGAHGTRCADARRQRGAGATADAVIGGGGKRLGERGDCANRMDAATDATGALPGHRTRQKIAARCPTRKQRIAAPGRNAQPGQRRRSPRRSPPARSST